MTTARRCGVDRSADLEDIRDARNFSKSLLLPRALLLVAHSCRLRRQSRRRSGLRAHRRSRRHARCRSDYRWDEYTAALRRSRASRSAQGFGSSIPSQSMKARCSSRTSSVGIDHGRTISPSKGQADVERANAKLEIASLRRATCRLRWCAPGLDRTGVRYVGNQPNAMQPAQLPADPPSAHQSRVDRVRAPTTAAF